jgi:hypothetical protein
MAGRVILVAAFAACASTAATAAAPPSPSSPSSPLLLSDSHSAVPFLGVGGISGGGATSRTLMDYPEPAYSHILDLLFSPQIGAAAQVFKVEVGGLADTTCGSEWSHRLDTADGGSCTRGYEWPLLVAAKARQPSILTGALQWAAPALVADPTIEGGTTLFTPADADYVVGWLSCLRDAYNISLDYMGAGWNEHSFNATYIKLLRQRMDAAGHAAVRLSASDEWDPNHCWAIADAMNADPDLNAAVDAISVHVAGVLEHNDPTPASALALGKPIFQGEEHFGLPDPDPVPNWDWAASGSEGIEVNENWILNNMSSTIYWPVIYAWDSGLAYRGKGFMTATSPWGATGTFFVPPTLWVAAHTTHFTAPRTFFLTNETSSGHVPAAIGYNVSYVTYVSPSTSAFSVVVESMFEGPYHSAGAAAAAAAPGGVLTVTFALGGNLGAWAGSYLHLWHTNQTVTFVREADVAVTPATPPSQPFPTVTLAVEPAAIYTLTTVASSHPGAREMLRRMGPGAVMVHADGTCEIPAREGEGGNAGARGAPAAPFTFPLPTDGPADDPFPIPFSDDYEGYANESLPLFTSDMFGGFAVYELAGTEDAPLPRRAPLREHPDPAVRASVACRWDDGGADYALRPHRCTPGPSPRQSPKVLRQWVRQPPLGWSGDAHNFVTIIGNYTLRNLVVNVSFVIEQPTPPAPPATGAEKVMLGLHAGSGQLGADPPAVLYRDPISAYLWTLMANGSWTLANGATPLSAGTANVEMGFSHTLSFTDGAGGGGGAGSTTLRGWLDDALLFSVEVTGQSQRGGGYVLLGTGVNRAQFDNLNLMPAV